MINKIVKYISNFPGWRTRRKVVVIESDDWGSIRMPSRKVFDTLSSKGLDLVSGDARRYNTNDTLATSEDISALYDTISAFKDRTGRHPIFTALSIMANPDFEKIRKSNFAEYHYEPFTETLKKLPGRENVLPLWLEGISNNLFFPQFHGREHLNVNAWMTALQQNDASTRLAFDYKMWGFRNKHPYNVSYQAAFDITTSDDIRAQHGIIKDGLQLFENIFGYKASYFVPPNGPFNNSLEHTAAASGIKYMCASKIQNEPLGYGKTRRVFHYIGQKNRHNQVYITRNCFFEPSQLGINWVDKCLSDIQIAFASRKPAVISSHRVNYIGALNEANRKHGLNNLKELLRSILTRWPNVEFMRSDELAQLIAHETADNS